MIELLLAKADVTVDESFWSIFDNHPYLLVSLLVVIAFFTMVGILAWKGINFFGMFSSKKYKELEYRYNDLLAQIKYWEKPDYMEKVAEGEYCGFYSLGTSVILFGKIHNYDVIEKFKKIWNHQKEVFLVEVEMSSDIITLLEKKILQFIEEGISLPPMEVNCKVGDEAILLSKLSQYMTGGNNFVKIIPRV